MTDATQDNPLAGKAALITGGAKRLGRAIALGLAQAGMDVAVTFNTSRDEAKQTCEQIQRLGRRALAVSADLADPAAADDIHDAVMGKFNRIDALVNNASVYDPSPIGTITADGFSRVMAVNTCAPLLLIQRFASALSANYHEGDPATAGRIVNLIDTHVLGQPHRGYAAYNASKAALTEITMTGAVELAPGITVNAIAPGVIAWPQSSTPQQRKQYLTRVPLNREGTLEEVAAAVVFLVRDAGYCTGQIIRLDGGRLLG